MSMQERTGHRPLLYSTWHRPDRIRRYLSAKDAARLYVVDIDFCEACPYCRQPLALIETERSDKSTRPKDAEITTNLARRAGIPAYSVLYVPRLPLVTCQECGRPCEDPADDIVKFYVRQVDHVSEVHEQTPGEYAVWLLSLRTDCACQNSQAEAI